jgi:hypothetical protein
MVIAGIVVLAIALPIVNRNTNRWKQLFYSDEIITK